MEEKKVPGQSEPELRLLNIQGDTYRTRYTRKYERRQAWTKPDERQVISFIPGTIRKVLVKEGDPVRPSDVLLVLDAMKMSNNIYAPLAGKVKSVLVKEGDCVPRGTLMVELE